MDLIPILTPKDLIPICAVGWTGITVICLRMKLLAYLREVKSLDVLCARESKFQVVVELESSKC